MDINNLLILTEKDNLLLEDYLEEGEIIKKAVSGAKKGVNAIDKTAKMVLLGIKKLHTTDEEYLAKGIPQLSKLLGRSIIIASTTTIPVVGPVLGIVTLYTSHALKKKFTSAEKDRLYNVYLDKIKYLDEKIDNAKSEKDDKEFEQLLKIRSKLKADAQRLKVLKMDELERKED